MLLASLSLAISLSGPGAQPRPAFGPKGDLFVAYGVQGKGIFVAKANAGAQAFSPPVLAAAGEKVSLGMRRGPRIAVFGENSVAVSFIAGDNLLVASSRDGGATWAAAKRVNRMDGSAAEGLQDLAAALDGTLFVIWNEPQVSGAKKGMTVVLSRSLDGGETWSEPVPIYDPPSGSICECCAPSIVCGPIGSLAAMFRNSLKGKRDPYVLSSKDQGKTFSPAVKLGKGSWNLNACPMDGGGVALEPSGKMLAAWRREEKVFASPGSDGEIDLGRGASPAIAASKDRAIVVWHGKEGISYANLRAGAKSGTIANSAEGKDPAIAVSPSGDFFVVWQSKDETGNPAVRGEFLR